MNNNKSRLIKLTKKEIIEVVINEDEGIITYWISPDNTGEAVIVDKKVKDENRVAETH